MINGNLRDAHAPVARCDLGPSTIDELGQKVIDKLNAECPEANWIASYAVLGPYDYLDLFEAPDNETATKVAVIVRTFGHATREIWPATPGSDSATCSARQPSSGRV